MAAPRSLFFSLSVRRLKSSFIAQGNLRYELALGALVFAFDPDLLEIHPVKVVEEEEKVIKMARNDFEAHLEARAVH